MFTILILGTVLLFSKNSETQLVNFDDESSEIIENSYDYENDYENDVSPNNGFDDNVWMEMQHNVQQFLNGDEYAYDEEETYDARRGIPMTTRRGPCVEKLEGPFNTTDGMLRSGEEVYPRMYYNVTCYPHPHQKSQDGHHMRIMCKPQGYNYGCASSVKLLPVFKTILNHKRGKKCWKPERSIWVRTGCKCSSP